MQVIVVASQKGGAGKTTTARHLAVEAERVGEGPVGLIDLDPQGSLAAWWNRRAADTPAFVETRLEALAATLADLRATGFRHVLVDTPPALGHIIAQAVRLADLVLVPCRPSPDDLDAVGATIDLVEAIGKPLVFVVNQATRKARLTGHAAITLSQHGVVAPVLVHHSVAIPGAAVGGLTIGEVDPDSPSAREVADLWGYVSARLHRQAGLPASQPEGRLGRNPARSPA